MCWDFFMEAHFRRTQQAESLCRLRDFARRNHWRIDWDLKKFLLADERVALVTDTAQIIRFATPNLFAMNGYEVNEVLGKTPRMFQGQETDEGTRARLREAIVRRLRA